MNSLTRYVAGLLLAVSILLSHIAMAAAVPAKPYLYADVIRLTSVQQAAVTKQKMQIIYLDYNWSLNDVS